MSSKSHKSFASRLGKAKTFHTYVSSYTDYIAPLETASVSSFKNTITAIETLQKQYNNVKSDYTEKINERKKIFYNNDNSLEKRLSLIRVFVKALKGKDHSITKQITSLVNKIRGYVKKTNTTSNSDTNTISKIECTYASRLANFNNIIDIISNLGESYNPPNNEISLASLQELATDAANSSAAIDTCLSVYKPIIDARQVLYSNLNTQSQAIKGFIKAQYGLYAKEYTQIKKLDI